MLNKKILLGSGSPRRSELMSELGLEFEVINSISVEEKYPSTLDTKDVAEYLANLKADAYKHFVTAESVLVTADTVVVIDNQILGKPKDKVAAKEMLRMLSGRTHKVITGVAIVSDSERTSFSVKTKVTMRSLTDEMIEYYVEKYCPTDKAGAYGIQEWIGLVGIDYIEGSYQNVMGLPTQRLYAELRNFLNK